MTHIEKTLARVNWHLLAEQKSALVKLANAAPDKDTENLLQGLLNLIDYLQDAAEQDGYPVVFLTEEESAS
jgi:hypothetical protein